MNISLPDALKSFVDAQVTERGYSTSSEYVRELIRSYTACCCKAQAPRRANRLAPPTLTHCANPSLNTPSPVPRFDGQDGDSPRTSQRGCGLGH